MTREEFINWFEGFTILTKNDIYELGQLYDEVTKSQWISVDDELPPKKGEYDDLSNNVLATDGKEIYESVYNYDFEDWFTHDIWRLDNITHWCYLPQLPVLSNSEKTGKNHLIDANNMVEHFRETTKMIEKGGEE